VARKVETGQDNNRMVRIISGVSESDEVLLTPPLAEGEVERERPAAADLPVADPSPAAADEDPGERADRREERKKRMEQMSPEERAAVREKMQKSRGADDSPAGSPESR